MKKSSPNYIKISSSSTKDKIGIIGATGRFGKAIVQVAEAEKKEVERLSARSPSENIGSQLWIYAALAPSLSFWLKKAVSQRVRLVVGTTGLSSQDLQELQKASCHIPLFYAPNFSLGIFLMQEWLLCIAKKFYRHADIDLIEMHHAGKKDAPSGTARLMADELQKLGRVCKTHSLRTGQIVGIHTVQFNTAEEKLMMTHEAHSPLAFARGALAAASFLAALPSGLYGMQDLLK